MHPRHLSRRAAATGQHGHLPHVQGTYVDEWPHVFVQQFTLNPVNGQMHRNSTAFRSFYCFTERSVTRAATPPIPI